MRGLALALALLAGGCLDAFEPDVGPPLRSSCLNVDSDPGTAVSFRNDIVPRLFQGQGIACLDCHAPDAPTPLGFEVSGLDLSTYTAMRAGGALSGSDIVVPGRPCDSLLLLKIGESPPVGGRMPLDGPPFVSDVDRQLLHDWIAEGARDN